MNATICERGNGFPDVGAYLPGDDGELYLIIELGSNISTNGPGAGNTIEAEVSLADWDDCDEDEIFPAQAILADDDCGDGAL